MPYKKKKEVPFIEFKRLLLGYELNAPKLAKILLCSESTARIKLNSPERFTLKDLSRIHVYGHIPLEEIRLSMKG